MTIAKLITTLVVMLLTLVGITDVFLNEDKVTGETDCSGIWCEDETTEHEEWDLYYAEAYAECADQFSVLYYSYEIKRAKNGAMMIRKPGDKTFKFCKKS